MNIPSCFPAECCALAPFARVKALFVVAMLLLGGRLGFAQIPAFPGAEGFGAYANGGRGGDVYYVMNLNTSGAGSFADAIATAPSSGRTIVFGVSGYIHVNKTALSKSRITIAGQTAPGDGIGFKDGTFIINGSDVVIRHARFRYGDQAAGGDCIDLDEGITNVILDHISLAFSTDENISSFEQNPRPDLISFQWSLNGWGLESHSCGGLWDLQRVTTHHTLWSHHHTRNPKARPYGLLDWINNVTFDWDIGFIMGDSTTPAPWKANVRGNYFICPPGNTRSVALEKASRDRNGNYNFTLHVATNLFDKNGNTVLDGSDYGYGIASGSYQVSNAPIVVAGTQVPVAIDPPLTAYKKIVSRAGPLRLDALTSVPLRDEVDTILVSNVVTLRRNHISHESQTGAGNNGMGFLNSSAAPVDTDRDGMADFWENTLGWNAAAQDHNTALANSGGLITGFTFFPTNTLAGYTRLEEYLHFLAIPHATIPRNTAAGQTSLNVNLRRYTSGFNRAPVVFSFRNVTNGTVALQPDGFTAVFIPTLDFAGRARFDFTVTDGDGSTWTQTFGVLVSSAALPRDLKWKGDGASNQWNTNAATFLDGTNVTAFRVGDNVLFDNAGSNTPSINLTMSLAPSSIDVNSTKNYTFAGAGSLAGAAPLTKSGVGTLTFATANSLYSGALELNGGTLAVASGSSPGSGPVTIGGGATMSLLSGSPSITVSGPVFVPAGQTATVTSSQLSSSFNGNFSSGDDSSVLNVTGSTSFGGTSTAQFDDFTGTIVVNAGATLRFAANSSGNTYGSLSPDFVINGTFQPRNAGNTITLGALNGAGTLAGPQSSAGSGNTTFIVGANNADGLFTGIISSNTATAGSLVGLTKLGSGQLTLSGNNSYSGATIVSAGRLVVNGTNSASQATVSSAALLGGAGRIGGLVTMNAGSRISPGNSVGTLTLGGGLALNGATLNYELANVTTVGGGVNDLIAMTGGTLTLSGVNTLVPTFLNGSLANGSYTLITGGSATVGSTANFAWGGPSGGRQTFSFDTATPGRVLLVVGGSPAANLVWTGAASSVWDTSTTNWLNGASPDVFFNLDSVLFDATGAGASTISLAAAMSPASILVNAASNYRFNGPGSLTGSGTLTKDGAGTLTIATTNNAYAGAINVNGGTLAIGNGVSLGSGLVTLRNGGTFTLPGSGGASFPGNPFFVPAGHNVTISSGGLGNGLTGHLSSGSTNSVLNLSGGVSFSDTTSAQFDDFTGTIIIHPGATLRFSANSSGNTYGSLKPSFVINGTFQPRNAGNTIQLGALSGSGTLAGQQTQPASGGGNGNTTYIIGANNLDGSFSGQIVDSNPTNVTFVTKTGAGRLTLSGNSTFSGGLAIEAGALIVNNTVGSGTGTGALNIAGGATLGGSGFIGSPTTLEDFAILAPGNPIGTLTFNEDLALSEFSKLQFTLGATSDVVAVNGALTLAGRLVVTNGAGFGTGTYTLFTYQPTNTFNLSDLVLDSAPAGYNYAFNTNTPGQVRLIVSVPTLPSFGSVRYSSSNLVVSGSGGAPGADYYVLSATNVDALREGWLPLVTNQFDGSGNFNWTNPAFADPQRFFRLEVP